MNTDNSFFDPVFQDLRCTTGIYLSTADQFIFWFGGAIVFFVTLFLIIGAIISKSLREQPGDIIVGIAFSDFILSIHWMTLASFPTDVDDSTFCRAIGALGVFAGITEFLYNASFSTFMVISLRNALRQSRIPKKTFHVFTLVAAAGYVTYLLAQGQIGKTVLGTCSIMTECSSNFLSYLGSLVVASYGFIGAFTYYYIYKYAPQCKRSHAKRMSFLMYYLRYIIACITIYSLIVVFTLLTTIVSNNSISSDGTIDPQERAKYSWINSMYNLMKLSSPLVLTAIRINDPKIKSVIKQGIFFWRRHKVQFVEDQLNPEQNLEVSETQNSQSLERTKSLNETGLLVFNQKLKNERKIEITYTLLSCIAFARHHQQRPADVQNAQIYDFKGNNRFKHEKIFHIDTSVVTSALPSVQKELERTSNTVLPGTFKVYSPDVFGGFVRQDAEFLNIIESLDLFINREQIKEASGSDGGKSGEFFFFSCDKKLIIKTVPDVELEMLISILERYETHFKLYPFSLIAKIYGAYTYENTDLGLKFNLIAMKNICGFPSEFIDRKYDMKGSKYDRETLKGQVTDEVVMRQSVLKDADFEKYEKKLFINQEVRQNFLTQIELDSLFFRSVNLIDYSFMVYIVNKKNAGEKMDLRKDFTRKNPLASIEHTEKPGIYYNMGIIDYLQPYNFQKALERFIKRLKKFDPNLDTSSQDPDYYSSRFIQFIRRLVMGS